MSPAGRFGFERSKPSSGQDIVARHLAERAHSVEPPPGLENPDSYFGDLDPQQHSTPLRGARHESSLRDIARVLLERLGHPLQRTQQLAHISSWTVRSFRRACRRCRFGRFVHGQRGVDPCRTLTKES